MQGLTRAVPIGFLADAYNEAVLLPKLPITTNQALREMFCRLSETASIRGKPSGAYYLLSVFGAGELLFCPIRSGVYLRHFCFPLGPM